MICARGEALIHFHTGILVVISAPSGGGKSTLAREILKQIPQLHFSVSVTTRSPREGEKEGRDYYFLSNQAFKEKKDSGQLVEYAEVHGHWYGTPKSSIEKHLREGKDILFDIDVQGGMQIKKIYPGAVLVFIAPPSIQILESRLRERRQDDEATIQRRLKAAVKEIDQSKNYDYLIVNEKVEQAVNQLRAIIQAEHLKMNRHT